MICNRIQAPCKNCTDRQLGCHDTCDKYIEYATELKALNDRIKEGNRHVGVDKKAIAFSHTCKTLKSRSHIK